jgi:hypothetical protein
MPRPSFIPTPEQRKLVRSLATLGLGQEHICEMVDLRSPKTLRKHFRQEIQTGYAAVMAQLARAAYEMAVSGTYPAVTRFWLQVHARELAHEQVGDPPRRRRQGPGAELIFRFKHAKAEAEMDGYKYMGEKGGYFFYKRVECGPTTEADMAEQSEQIS